MVKKIAQSNTGLVFRINLLFIITAGFPSQFTEAAVPVFTTPSVSGRTVPVPETVQAGTSVYRIIAVDADNDLLVYSMTSQSPSLPQKFNINSMSGVISTLEEFDVDLEDSVTKYEISVRVTDGLSSIQTSLFMEIIDENDNNPVFMHYYVIREKTKPGFIIADMCAKDIDSGKNSLVTYDIIGGNTDNAFAIDSETGILYTRYELNRTVQDNYSIVVKARDSGATPRSSTTTVTIKLSPDIRNKAVSNHQSSLKLLSIIWMIIIVSNVYL